MTKVELVAAVAEKTGFSKKVSETILISVLDCITESLQNGEEVSLVGFGTFEIRERAERDGVNPQTQEKIRIKAAKVPVFKPSKIFKGKIDNS